MKYLILNNILEFMGRRIHSMQMGKTLRLNIYFLKK